MLSDNLKRSLSKQLLNWMFRRPKYVVGENELSSNAAVTGIKHGKAGNAFFIRFLLETKNRLCCTMIYALQHNDVF